MIYQKTRFDNEAERIKNTYESIDTILGNISLFENEFIELIKDLVGFDNIGHYDPDLHQIAKIAVYQWLKYYEYFKQSNE